MQGTKFSAVPPKFSLPIIGKKLSFNYVTCRNVSGYLEQHKNFSVLRCGSGVKVNDYLVFKGTFSR